MDDAGIRNVVQRNAARYRPQRIILFGSRAYGTPRADSDVDLLVIMPFRGDSAQQSLDILNFLDVRWPLDVVARTPEDVAMRLRYGDPLVCDAIELGRVLYEAAA